MNQTLENGKKKLILGRILVCLTQIWPPPNISKLVLPLLVVRNCSKPSSKAIKRKTNEKNLRK